MVMNSSPPISLMLGCEQFDGRRLELPVKYEIKFAAQLKLLLLLVLSFNIVSDVIHQRISDKSTSVAPNSLTCRLTRGLLQVVAVVAAADTYSDSTADSPSVEAALEDEDDDDEELDASASNEYPDGDNDSENDESYEDGDDDRQESRLRESWIAPPKILINDGIEDKLKRAQVRFRTHVENDTIPTR